MWIHEMSKFSMIVVITGGKIPLGSLPTFLLSLNPWIGLFNFSSTIVSSFLFIAINLTIFLFIVPLNGFFGWGKPIGRCGEFISTCNRGYYSVFDLPPHCRWFNFLFGLRDKLNCIFWWWLILVRGLLLLWQVILSLGFSSDLILLSQSFFLSCIWAYRLNLPFLYSFIDGIF